METTRKFPRSMAEAFPQDRATWIEGPHRLGLCTRAGIVVGLVIVFAIAAAIVIVEGLRDA